MPGTPLPIGSFTSPQVKRVHYGEGCLSGLPAAVDELGGARVFIITGHSLMQQGTILGRIQELLGDRCVGVFGETRQHVPRATVLAATRAAQSADADLLISFGGGTPNDTAKLVALCLAENVTNERQLDRYRIRFQYPDKVEIPAVHNPCLPHISVSTTLSAGEFTNFAWGHRRGTQGKGPVYRRWALGVGGVSGPSGHHGDTGMALGLDWYSSGGPRH